MLFVILSAASEPTNTLDAQGNRDDQRGPGDPERRSFRPLAALAVIQISCLLPCFSVRKSRATSIVRNGKFRVFDRPRQDRKASPSASALHVSDGRHVEAQRATRSTSSAPFRLRQDARPGAASPPSNNRRRLCRDRGKPSCFDQNNGST